MSAKAPRELELSLSFLGTGRYAVTVWKDGPDADVDPNQLKAETLEVFSGDQLRIHVAVDGGFVARITPIR
jgi:alpha-glucosidase